MLYTVSNDFAQKGGPPKGVILQRLPCAGAILKGILSILEGFPLAPTHRRSPVESHHLESYTPLPSFLIRRHTCDFFMAQRKPPQSFSRWHSNQDGMR